LEFRLNPLPRKKLRILLSGKSNALAAKKLLIKGMSAQSVVPPLRKRGKKAEKKKVTPELKKKI
jgi:hypothetical protein